MKCMKGRTRYQCRLVVDPKMFHRIEAIGKYDSLVNILVIYK